MYITRVVTYEYIFLTRMRRFLVTLDTIYILRLVYLILIKKRKILNKHLNKVSKKINGIQSQQKLTYSNTKYTYVTIPYRLLLHEIIDIYIYIYYITINIEQVLYHDVKSCITL